MNHWVAYFFAYYAVGLAWLAFNFASAPELMVKSLRHAWELGATKWWGQPFLVMVIAFVSPLVWPGGMMLYFFRDTEVGKRYLRFAMKSVRSAMDRPGLLEPQMPAPRCHIHDMALDSRAIECSTCKAPLWAFFCVACCKFGPPPLPETGFMCDACVEKS